MLLCNQFYIKTLNERKLSSTTFKTLVRNPHLTQYVKHFDIIAPSHGDPETFDMTDLSVEEQAVASAIISYPRSPPNTWYPVLSWRAVMEIILFACRSSIETVRIKVQRLFPELVLFVHTANGRSKPEDHSRFPRLREVAFVSRDNGRFSRLCPSLPPVIC